MEGINLDNLPLKVRRAIYQVFSSANVRDKIVFLSRLKYGNDLSYTELADMTGVTFQRTQQMYDNMLQKVAKSPYLVASGIMISGLLV